jgi:hypothetical protein
MSCTCVLQLTDFIGYNGDKGFRLIYIPVDNKDSFNLEGINPDHILRYFYSSFKLGAADFGAVILL